MPFTAQRKPRPRKPAVPPLKPIDELRRMVPSSDTTRTWVSRAIMDELKKILPTGVRSPDIVDDWMTLSIHTLERLPAHFESVLKSGQYADDTPEAAAAFERAYKRYRTRHYNYYQHIERAFTLLIAGAKMDYTPWHGATYANLDHVGLVYEQMGYLNSNLGQFFTPWSVCDMMAGITWDERELVDKLTESIHGIKADRHDPVFQFVRAPIKVALENNSAELPDMLTTAFKNGFKPIEHCDPCIGSGRTLLAIASRYPPAAHAWGLVTFYGQDIDRNCVNMARLNFLVYGLNGWHAKFVGKLSDETIDIFEQWKRTQQPTETVAYNPSGPDLRVNV